MPDIGRIPYEAGTTVFECFKDKAIAGDVDYESQSIPFGQFDECAVYYNLTNTANDVVDIPLHLQISADGRNWEDAGTTGITGYEFTNPFDTITLVSGNEAKWQVLVNPPTYSGNARIRLRSGATTVGCTLTLHVVIGRAIG